MNHRIMIALTGIGITALAISWVAIFNHAIEKEEIHHKLFHYTNVERTNPLKWDECLAEQAELRAEDIHKSGEFTHEGWQEYVLKCSSGLMGENLTINYVEFYEAHTGLMNSELHRENILRKEFNKMGVGCYEKVCVQFFSK